MIEKIEIKIPVDVKVNERLQKLIDKFGKEKVADVLGNYFAYDLLKEIGDVYKDAIILDDIDMDAIEEILTGN